MAQWQAGQLVFQPPQFNWNADDQQFAFDEWKGQITLALRASSIKKEIWFATNVSYLGKEGFRRWNTLPISKDEAAQQGPEAVFQAIADTLEVSGTILMQATMISSKEMTSQ